MIVTTFFMVTLLRGNHPPVPTCQRSPVFVGEGDFLRSAASEGVLRRFNRSELSLCIGSLSVPLHILISFNAGQTF